MGRKTNTKQNNGRTCQNPNTEKDNQISDEEKYLQMWQTCVEMANNTSDKRISTNTVYMTIDIGLMAVLTFAFDIKNLLLCIIGIVVSIIWEQSIKKYKHLNKAKYEVIYDIENHLGYSPFKIEWEIIGNKEKESNTLTSVESKLPLVFIAMFAITAIWSIPVINIWIKSLPFVSALLGNIVE